MLTELQEFFESNRGRVNFEFWQTFLQFNREHVAVVNAILNHQNGINTSEESGTEL